MSCPCPCESPWVRFPGALLRRERFPEVLLSCPSTFPYHYCCHRPRPPNPRCLWPTAALWPREAWIQPWFRGLPCDPQSPWWILGPCRVACLVGHYLFQSCPECPQRGDKPEKGKCQRRDALGTPAICSSESDSEQGIRNMAVLWPRIGLGKVFTSWDSVSLELMRIISLVITAT